MCVCVCVFLPNLFTCLVIVVFLRGRRESCHDRQPRSLRRQRKPQLAHLHQLTATGGSGDGSSSKRDGGGEGERGEGRGEGEREEKGERGKEG